MLALMGSFALLSAAFMQLPEDDIQAIIANKLKTYLSTRPQEKVYLHTDKPYYAAGDTVWMKGYLVDAAFHEADSISRVLYVNLTNETGELIDRRILEAANGYSVGEFVLPDSLAEGRYQLTAFTNWMRNATEDFFFRKNFQVFRPNAKKNSENPNLAEPTELQFFPEGGYLVEGLRSKLAFKALNANGYGVKVEGVVEEVGGAKVLDFKDEYLGMGAFMFTPQAGKNYVAKIKSGAKYLSIPLPSSQKEGIVISVGNLLAENVKFSLSHNYSSEKAANEPFLLVAHARGRQVFSGVLPKNPTSQFYINRSKFPIEGLILFTMFDKKMNPIAERVIFNEHPERLNLQVNGLKAAYAPRERVDLTLTATDAQGKAVRGNFSVAVTSASQIPDDGLYTDHIVSNLLMTSELRGTIEQPARYFDPTNEYAKQHLDLLMLTQGWRRFVWKDVLQDQLPPAQYSFEQGLTISGRVNLPQGKKIEKLPISLVLASEGEDPLMLGGEANAEGEFSIPNVAFSGWAQVALKGLGKNSTKGATLVLRSSAAPSVGTQTQQLPSALISKDLLYNYLTKIGTHQKVNTALKPLNPTATDKPATKDDTPGTDVRRRLYGTPDFSLKVTEAISDGTSDVFQLMRGRVPGLTGTGNNLQLRGISSFVSNSEPLYLLDGVPTDKGTLMGTPPKAVEYIDVLKGASASSMGSRGAGGVINILTKRGYANSSSEESNSRVRGYSLVREFYAPNYTATKPTNAVPDYRSTIHWVPMLQTDANGKASISFWNSDESNAKFRIVVEGATAKGQLGVSKTIYQIQ